MPYTRYMGRPFAVNMLEWIVELSSHNLKLNMEDFKDLGKRSLDEENF